MLDHISVRVIDGPFYRKACEERSHRQCWSIELQPQQFCRLRDHQSSTHCSSFSCIKPELDALSGVAYRSQDLTAPEVLFITMHINHNHLGFLLGQTRNRESTNKLDLYKWSETKAKFNENQTNIMVRVSFCFVMVWFVTSLAMAVKSVPYLSRSSTLKG